MSSLSNFDIRNTPPGLQQDFLTLWDEIDQEAKNNRDIRAILEAIRSLYDALDQGTDDTSTAPPASNADPHGHPSHPTSLMYTADEDAHTHTTTSLPVSHYEAGLITHSPSPVLAHTIPDLADEFSPRGAPDVMQHITQVAAPPDPTSEPLESHRIPASS